MKRFEDRPKWVQMALLIVLAEIILCSYVFLKIWVSS